jgi:hypothetical protein
MAWFWAEMGVTYLEINKQKYYIITKMTAPLQYSV